MNDDRVMPPLMCSGLTASSYPLPPAALLPLATLPTSASADIGLSVSSLASNSVPFWKCSGSRMPSAGPLSPAWSLQMHGGQGCGWGGGEPKR